VCFVAFGRLIVLPVCFVAFGRLIVLPISFTLSFFAFCFGHEHLPLTPEVLEGLAPAGPWPVRSNRRLQRHRFLKRPGASSV
jgi:hypothetical protein